MTIKVRVGEKNGDKENWYWLIVTNHAIIKTPFIYRIKYREGCDRIYRLSAEPLSSWEYIAYRCY